MSGFFGQVAGARTKVLDAKAVQDKEAREEALKLALLRNSMKRESDEHQARMLSNGFVPDTATSNAGPADSPSAPTIPGYRFSTDVLPEVRRRRAQRDERASSLRAFNSSVPASRRISDEKISLIAGNDALYNKWTEKNLGIANDPIATHIANRNYDVQHPIRSDNGVQLRAGLGAVEKQVAEGREDLRRTTPKPLGPIASRSDSVQFRQKSQAAAAIQNRVDSLSKVRDRLAGDVQGNRHPESSQQQRDWDEAAAVLRARGQNPANVIGARPKQ